MRDEEQLDNQIDALLADLQYADHPLRAALDGLYQRQQEQVAQLERLTSISDGYQSVLQKRYQSLTQRHQKQMKQLQKIVKISDHYQKILQDLNETLKIASTQDPLTGLFNRRLMITRLENEAALARRRLKPFSILMIDVDHFKRVNDDFGHATGDAALIGIANTLTSALRVSDVCSRWGGEEFLIMLPDTTALGAEEIAHRLRVNMQNLRVEELPEDRKLTLSIGIAEHVPLEKLDDAIKRADDALYAAKNAGRNRVVQGEPVEGI